MNSDPKRIILKELGFLLISGLLVALFYFLAGTFLKIWIEDYTTLIYMTVIFYFIIGFYRWLNALARKYQRKDEDH
jgi:hypothetical protein